MISRWLCAGVVLALLAGCAGGGGSRPESGSQAAAAKGSGGRYAMQNDAYPDQPPDVSNIPDAVPRVEPLASSGNRPTYEVWGQTYHVLPDAKGYVDQGKASWYGEKFQGYATASGEVYDMYKMSAAHRSLPLPTYARVTNLDNGRQVIVKVNDRGPFHGDRLIDLSYAAAGRLGILRNGTGHVRVAAIDPVAWQAKHGNAPRTKGESVPGGSPAPQVASSAVTKAARPSVAPVSAGPTARSSVAQASSNKQPVASAAPPPVPAADVAGTPGAAGQHLFLQVAALGSAANAQALRQRLQSKLDSPVRIDSDNQVHRVQVGPVADRLALEALRSELRSAGYAQSFAVTDSD